jgi:hypothetical protein
MCESVEMNNDKITVFDVAGRRHPPPRRKRPPPRLGGGAGLGVARVARIWRGFEDNPRQGFDKDF